MPTSVKIQTGTNSMLLPLWILGIFLIVMLIRHIVKSRKNAKLIRKSQQAEPVIKHVTPTIKEKYIKILSDLREKYLNGDISDKDTYRQLSFNVRKFIEVSTGFDMTNKTLSEIKLMNLPKVESVIEDIYLPEFSEHKRENLEKIIDKAIKVIEEWS